MGWINFDSSSVAGPTGQVTIDMGTGKLNGFAWGQNFGWINFTDSNVITDLSTLGTGKNRPPIGKGLGKAMQHQNAVTKNTESMLLEE